MAPVSDVISGRSHTSLKLFRALGQFKKMAKSPQIMGINKQKVLQNLHNPYFTSKLVSFKLIDQVRLESCQV